MTGRTRVAPHVVTMPDGTRRPQTKKPRVDVLYYPETGWTTLLCRFTHDEGTARLLATTRWRELQAAGLVPPATPLVDGYRPGWWTTGQGDPRWPRPGDAIDELGRVVRCCPDPLTTAHAGAALELRPAVAVPDPIRRRTDTRSRT